LRCDEEGAVEIIPFDTRKELETDALALLTTHFVLDAPGPFAVMLTGGRTPLDLYRRLAARPVSASANLHVMLTDERHVPVDSPESNYGNMRDMLAACRVPGARVLRVRTDFPLQGAASGYDAGLAHFFEHGGRLALACLGLGADGHVASLFSAEDVRHGAGRHAIAVRRPDGPARISVTRDVLHRAERLVFLVTGREKEEALDRLANDPKSIPAGLTLHDKDHVEVWFAE
jgi:6-phosphogluconolactonase